MLRWREGSDMSAYIVSERTMVRVVNAIATAEERKGLDVFTDSAVALAKAVLAGDAAAAVPLADEVSEYTRDPNAGLTKLGRELYRMNQAAVIARYGDRPDDDYQAIPEFRFTPGLLEGNGDGWRVTDGESAAVSAVAELVYQCSEGDVPTWPLYQRLAEAEQQLREEWKAGAAERAKAKAAADNERQATERANLPAAHPHLLTRAMRPNWSAHRLAAENIRRELKRRFPGVKFSVTSESYAGGNSVDVRWTDGPTAKEVEAVANRHAAGSFDGMTDLYEYDRDNVFGEVFGATKYVHCEREWTLAAVRKANGDESIPENWAAAHDYDRAVRIRRKWAETSFPA
jgi:hypothetical protein